MKSMMFIRILALSLLFLAIASVGSVYSQSRNRDNPTPLTSNEVSGIIDKKTKDDTYYYYSFWANPGEVKITATVERNLNIDNTFTLTSVEFVLYDSSSEVIARKSASTYSGSGTQPAITTAEVQITKRQTLVLGIKLPGGVYFGGVGKYKVQIEGAIEFSGKRFDPSAKEQTEPRKTPPNDLGLAFALSSEREEFHEKAEALRKNKQYREAIENYSREIDLANNRDKLSTLLLDAYLYRGDCKLEIEDNRGAIADYDQFFKIIEPIEAEIPPEIIASLRTLEGLGSKKSHAHNSRGVAKNKLGDKVGACEDFRKSCSMGKSEACKNALNVCH